MAVVHIGTLNNGEELGERLRTAKYEPVSAEIIVEYTGTIEQALLAQIPKVMGIYAIKMSPGAEILDIDPSTNDTSVHFFLPKVYDDAKIDRELKGILEALGAGKYVFNNSSEEDLFLLVMKFTSATEEKE